MDKKVKTKEYKDMKEGIEKKLTPEEVYETLNSQHSEYSANAERFITLKTKVEGALEMLVQMHPELTKTK
mgnify:FL=1|tara:strand:- start:3190 stop:3399 length:210 start_codon:yes stop_codon:yes gene_type:complete